MTNGWHESTTTDAKAKTSEVAAKKKSPKSAVSKREPTKTARKPAKE